MRDLIIAGGFGLIIAALVRAVFDCLGIALIALLVPGIAMMIGGIILKTKKSPSDEVIGTIDGGKERGYKSLEPSVFRRIINWLRDN